MEKVNRKSLKRAIKNLSKLSLKEKESIVDEIYLSQPHLLASVLVLNQMGQSLEDIDILLNILIICHLSLEDAGIKLKKITEDDQDKEMARFVGKISFNDGLSLENESLSIENYISNHNEKLLMYFAFNKMVEADFTARIDEDSKYLLIAGINMINCISAAEQLTS